MESIRQRTLISWLALGILALLCAMLAVLQYRWIGQLSLAQQDRLRETLQASLNRLARDFNGEITAACAALIPPAADFGKTDPEAAYARRLSAWHASSDHKALFRRLVLAIPQEHSINFRQFDSQTGAFVSIETPQGWAEIRQWMQSKLAGNGGMPPVERTTLIDLPRFNGSPEGSRGTEQEWLIAEVDEVYAVRTLLPSLLNRFLGEGAQSEFAAEVTPREDRGKVLYRSAGDEDQSIQTADATVGLFPAHVDVFRREPGPRGGEAGQQPPPAKGPPPGAFGSDRSRWLLAVRHRSGSLESAVAWHRRRNMAISGLILVLMAASAVTLFRLSRRAQRLADMQMQFVAGVSHELRTPLTVIRTAAFNLRGKIAGNPAQVERYGVLIQQESEKLGAILEQILRFASAKAGQVIRTRQPMGVDELLESTVQSCRTVIEGGRCVLEKSIEPGLPLILGDSLALRHALQNLIHNAVKYGTEGSNWIGVSARSAGQEIEIRVADHGPGIPASEQEHIFDPFFRGERAVQDQIHGTGLGLSLVRQIVEAHGGTISVESEPMKGTAFVIRLPIAPAEQQDEFANTAG